jgi:hypothetical protein
LEPSLEEDGLHQHPKEIAYASDESTKNDENELTNHLKQKTSKVHEPSYKEEDDVLLNDQ